MTNKPACWPTTHLVWPTNQFHRPIRNYQPACLLTNRLSSELFTKYVSKKKPLPRKNTMFHPIRTLYHVTDKEGRAYTWERGTSTRTDTTSCRRFTCTLFLAAPYLLLSSTLPPVPFSFPSSTPFSSSLSLSSPLKSSLLPFSLQARNVLARRFFC